MKIESTANVHFKRFLSLTTSRGLKNENLLLLSGEKQIREFLKSPHLNVVAELLSPEQHLVYGKTNSYRFSKDLFNQLDTLGTHFNILVLEQPQVETWNPENSTALGLELVCPLGDPGNLGALARSALALGASKLILTRESAHPFLPKALKASAGSLLYLPLAQGPQLSELITASSELIILDKVGTPIEEFNWPKNCRLLVGEEGPGFSNLDLTAPNLKRIRIPTKNVESLNAVVATSIALYSFQQKQF